MSDLVKRLRQPPFGTDTSERNLMAAAAERIAEMEAALNYVADMTFCGVDAEWHFKKDYDPQVVLDAIS